MGNEALEAKSHHILKAAKWTAALKIGGQTMDF